MLPSSLLLQGEDDAAGLFSQNMVAVGMQDMDALLAEHVSCLILRKGEDDLIPDALDAHVISCVNRSHSNHSPKRDGHPHPVPNALLAAWGEGTGCSEFSDNCKFKIPLTAGRWLA